MKTDQLIGILSILLQRDKVTAPALAEQLEVSRRTIQRDIDSLCRAGIPIATPQGEAAFPDLPKAAPYEGAKDSFLVEDVENREWMTALVRITCEALQSAPQKTRMK